MPELFIYATGNPQAIANIKLFLEFMKKVSVGIPEGLEVIVQDGANVYEDSVLTMPELFIYVRGSKKVMKNIKRFIGFREKASAGTPEGLEVIVQDSADVYKDSVLAIDYGLRKVQVRGEDVSLANLEFKLLEALTSQPNVPLSKEAIGEALWGKYDSRREHSIKTYIQTLRAKLEEDRKNPTLIVTVKNVGYAYMSPDSQSQH